MSNPGTKKLFVETHGCQMNEYDSARMADLLGASHGLEQTDSADEADVLLLNTCSIREKAQEKVFHQLGRWKHLKQKNPDLIIGVGGGSKIYNAEEAAAVGNHLNPKRVIPAQYVNGDAPEDCDQEGVQPFLDAMGSTAVRRVGRSQTLPGRLGDTTVITVMQ